MLHITRYSIKNECLKPFIKFIWSFETKSADIHYKMLPTDCIDIILNLSGNIIYETSSYSISSTPFHINGLRREYSYIHQVGDIRVFGISFYAFGLYPFVHKSLADICNKIVDLFELSMSLARKLEDAVYSDIEVESILENIEKALCQQLQVNSDYIKKSSLIHDFLERDSGITIKDFCFKNSINTKTFMRNVKFYTGYTPKELYSIKRFQKCGNQLIYQSKARLSEIAYNNYFSDQAHFTREFLKFSGASPDTFRKEKITVKENTKYNYN